MLVLVVDVSKHFSRILEINEKEGWARVEPGIVRDDLNQHLKPYGFFFAPETSTANRAMIGGMIGNNSCGSNSVVYGSTREHLIEIEALLSDGTKTAFGPIENDEFLRRVNGSQNNLEQSIYKHINTILSNAENIQAIEKEFPKASIERRNTGYAIDMIARMQPFNEQGKPFNFASLIAGSEGTLAFVTSAKIKLTPLDPPHKKLVCIHCTSIDESLRANLVALEHKPSAVELMDHYVFEATKRTEAKRKIAFLLRAIHKLYSWQSLRAIQKAKSCCRCQCTYYRLKKQGVGVTHNPIVGGDDIKKVWNLRKAGLGLLSNIPGDDKPVPVIEDTAVDVKDLPAYIADVGEVLKKHGLYSVHYAHAGSGELHLRPIIDLKTTEGVKLFRTIAEDIATLVKKYKGSLSGEHGDGRLRG